MPELPDLEIIKEVLQRRVVGRTVTAVEVLRPLILRVLDPQAAPEDLFVGHEITSVSRRGKMLLLNAADASWLVINMMLAGRLRLCAPNARVRVRDYLVWHLDDGQQLRYYDPKGMGKVYLTRDPALVPGYSELGPDALSPELTLPLFLDRMRHYPGEIKGVLTRGALAAGIGNAYADEILFGAGIYPFRRSSSLTKAERESLYQAMRAVLCEAIDILRPEVGEEIDHEVRDYLKVHLRGGQPCPRCGQIISQIEAANRVTSFCRNCQPGSLIRS